MSSVRFPIRAKLTVATLLPLCVAIIICWCVGVVVITNRIAGQAQEKVRNDLNAAREVYHHELDHIHDVVRFTAAAPYTVAAFAETGRETLPNNLARLLTRERLDIFTAVDITGTVR